MFSYSSAPFTDNVTCTKCSLFTVFEARLSDLEDTIRTLQIKLVPLLASQPPLADAGQWRDAPLRPPATPEQQEKPCKLCDF